MEGFEIQKRYEKSSQLTSSDVDHMNSPLSAFGDFFWAIDSFGAGNS